jgi:hypothetical protein
MGYILGRGDSRIARATRELPLRHISLNRTRFVSEGFGVHPYYGRMAAYFSGKKMEIK